MGLLLLRHANVTPGRQGSGYFKQVLLSFWRIDGYVLKFPKGSHIPKHIDPVITGKSHYRLNIVLNSSFVGGHYKGKSLFNFKNRIILLRPDIHPHSVTEILSGTRWVLSFGLLLNKE